jgi:hypothetical protein
MIPHTVVFCGRNRDYSDQQKWCDEIFGPTAISPEYLSVKYPWCQIYHGSDTYWHFISEVYYTWFKLRWCE